VHSFFLAYWRAARRDGNVPAYDDFDPRDVKSYLRWVIVADALADYSDFRYRVVGTRVTDYFLGDGTGRTVREVFAEVPDFAQFCIYLYARACVTERPVRYAAPASNVEGIYFPTFDALFLPYSSDGERADRVIVAFVFNADAMRAKRPQPVSLVGAINTPATGALDDA